MGPQDVRDSAGHPQALHAAQEPLVKSEEAMP